MFESENAFRAATRAVWEGAYQDYAGWAPADRDTARAAVSALLAALRASTDEEDLQRRYWEVGDPLGRVLRAALPKGFDEDRLLTIEEACLWRRLLELQCGTPACST